MPRPRPKCTPIITPIPEQSPEPTPAELLADGVLRIREAAAFLGHGRSWLLDQLKAGKLESFMCGGRRVIARRVLVAYLAEQMARAS
jgi:hypothetical protein